MPVRPALLSKPSESNFSVARSDSIRFEGKVTDQPVSGILLVKSSVTSAEAESNWKIMDRDMAEITVTAIPAFADNYIWLVSTGGDQCAVVDPGDAGPVEQVLKQTGLELSYILITHHHADHTGGMAELVSSHGAQVYGPADSRISGLDRTLAENDTVSLPLLELEFRVLEVPGHTRSHIAFYGHGCLFCGDTLFSAGCGRLFEGTPEQMQVSLDKLAALPADTQVFCAHEYTLSNCDFARAVEPDNVQLLRRASEVEAARAIGRSTVPSQLGEELAVNPFLRSREPSVIAAAQKRNPGAEAGASTLAEIRAWKDSF
jgi:hydroxyacylglutathione hydrolase